MISRRAAALAAAAVVFGGITATTAVTTGAGAVTAAPAAAATKVTPSTLAASGWRIDPDPATTTAPPISAEQIPAGEFGSLKFATPNANGGKVNLYHAAPAGLTLAQVTAAGYDYFKPAASPGSAAVSYQLLIDTNGAAADTPTAGFATLVYEPVYNGGPVAGAWTTADVVAGRVWSTRPLRTPIVSDGDQDPKPFSRFAEAKKYGTATVLAYGLSQGSAVGDKPPTVTSYGDHVGLNTAVANFETDPAVTPAAGTVKAIYPACGKVNIAVSNAAAAPNTVRPDLEAVLSTEGQKARRLLVKAGTTQTESYVFAEDASDGRAQVVVRLYGSRDPKNKTVVKIKTDCVKSTTSPTPAPTSASPTASPTSASPKPAPTSAGATSMPSSAPTPAPSSPGPTLVPVGQSSGGDDGGGLAYTGASPLLPVGIGAGLLAGGAVLLFAIRRRRTS